MDLVHNSKRLILKVYRDPHRIAPKATDVPPNKRIRRLLRVCALIALWCSGFGAGLFLDNVFRGELLGICYACGSFVLLWISSQQTMKYGSGKGWYVRYITLQRTRKNCGICKAGPGENCDPGLHS